MKTIREYLDLATCTREEIDTFLDPNAPNWAVFDPELGFLLRDSIRRDGLNDCCTVARYAARGERKTINFADRPCRINTYGNSFTQCHQVSDGETWQEYLAAHIGEPIRNLGVGGYGVYQAYRRMLRTESSSLGGEYIILNILGEDDHLRSLDAWRWLRLVEWRRTATHLFHSFHSNPWAYVRIDPASGSVVECPSLLTTPESLYQLTDKEFVYETFKDDVVLHMILGHRADIEVPTEKMAQLAETLGLDLDFTSTPKRCESARALQLACGLRATMFTLDKAQAFAEQAGKKLMILLCYSDHHIVNAIDGKPRFDQVLLDHMRNRQIPYVDVLTKHAEDYKAFRLSPKEYLDRYFIAHYSPVGNHFFAFAIKNEVVDWLEPKPLAYRYDTFTVPFEEYFRTP